PFPAMRDWRQVWTVGLQKNPVSGDAPRDLRQSLRIWERHDPRKGDKETQFQRAPGELIARREAVNHTTNWSCLFKNFFGISVSIAWVDDDGQIQFFCESQLPPKDFSLNVAGRIVVKVIEARLADGNDFLMLRRLFHLGVVPLFDFAGIMRMYTDTGVNPIVRVGDWDPTTHLIRTAAVTDRQYHANSGIPCALQRRVTMGIETRIIEVCV